MKWLAAGVLGLCLPAIGLDRLALVVGDNRGLSDEKPLSFATRDAEQVYSALSQLGGLDKGSGTLLLDAGADQVRLALKSMRERVRSLKAQGRKSQILLYYSGHGSDDALHLDGASLPLSEVREYFAGLEADFKLLVSDACFSGSLIQAKGAGLSDPVPIRYQDELSVNGSAILTSSSAGELSQESKELQGSLFTHFFVTALRGAADFDRDGKITLWEAYAFTQASLRRRLAGNKSPAQTPGFDVQARGSDNVVLTRLELGQAFLTLQGLPADEYRILQAMDGMQVAEFRLSDPEGLKLALPRAAYLVYRGRNEVGYADLRRGKGAALGPEDFRPAGGERLAAKGSFRNYARAFDLRDPVQIAAQPRWYPAFPRRGRSAMALEAGLTGNLGDWGAGLSGLFLPKAVAEGGGTGRLEQSGLGVSGELRYYWSYSRAGAFFLGPRGEYWSIGQQLNGLELPRADLLGAFAALGLERSLGAGFSASVSAGAGWFFSRAAGGRVDRVAAFPVSLSLRFGP